MDCDAPSSRAARARDDAMNSRRSSRGNNSSPTAVIPREISSREAILLAPPPTQRYFMGVVAEEVSGELRYCV